MKRSSSLLLSLLVLSSAQLVADQTKQNKKKTYCTQTKQENAELISFATDIYIRAHQIIKNTKSRKTATRAKSIQNDNQIKSILEKAADKDLDPQQLYRQASIIAYEQQDEATQIALYFLSKDSVKTWLKKHPLIAAATLGIVTIVSGLGSKKILNWLFIAKDADNNQNKNKNSNQDNNSDNQDDPSHEEEHQEKNKINNQTENRENQSNQNEQNADDKNDNDQVNNKSNQSDLASIENTTATNDSDNDNNLDNEQTDVSSIDESQLVSNNIKNDETHEQTKQVEQNENYSLNSDRKKNNEDLDNMLDKLEQKFGSTVKKDDHNGSDELDLDKLIHDLRPDKTVNEIQKKQINNQDDSSIKQGILIDVETKDMKSGNSEQVNQKIDHKLHKKELPIDLLQDEKKEQDGKKNENQPVQVKQAQKRAKQLQKQLPRKNKQKSQHIDEIGLARRS